MTSLTNALDVSYDSDSEPEPPADLVLALKSEIESLKQNAARQAALSAKLNKTVAAQQVALNEAVEALKKVTAQQKEDLKSVKKSLPRRHRNLVVCIDGTSNQFGKKNTNVVELYHRLIQDEGQLTFYNSGIGTYATPSWKSFTYYKQVIVNKIDLAIAWNFEKTVLSAYRWLSENYEDGDIIFLFGFSRGAYQIRTIAAMIHAVGLIQKGNQDQIPFAYELYAQTKKSQPSMLAWIFGMLISGILSLVASARRRINHLKNGKRSRPVHGSLQTREVKYANRPEMEKATTLESDRTEMCKRFKETFSRKNVEIRFVGAWDTVSSVGLVREKTLPGTTDGMQGVKFFRHALALDERRVKFLQENSRGGEGPSPETTVPGGNGEPPHTKEVWFAGSHGDIGGGAVSNLDMNQFGPSLRWMLFEAAVAGLQLNKTPYRWEDNKIPDIHNSLKGAWRLIEYIPMKYLSYKDDHDLTFQAHRGRPRTIKPRQLIHSTALKSKPIRPEWRANLPSAQQWDSLQSDSPLIEADPYTQAKTLIFKIKEALVEGVEIDVGELADSLISLASTEPGIASLRDAPEPDDTIIALMALYSKVREPAILKASSAIAGAVLSNSVRVEKYYSTDQLQPIIEYGQAEPGSDLWEQLQTIFAQAQARPPLEHPEPAVCIAYLPNGERLYSGCGDGAVRIWDLNSGAMVGAPLTEHSDWVRSLAVSLNGSMIASASDDKTIRLWDVETGIDIVQLEGHSGGVVSVDFSPDGTRIVSCSLDKTIRVWDIASGSTVVGPIGEHSQGVYSVVYSPDGSSIVSGSWDRTVRCWDAATGLEQWQIKTSREAVSVAYYPDGTRVVAGCMGGSVLILDTKSGKMIRSPLTGHTGLVHSVALSHDGKKIASASDDGTIRLWDSGTGQELDVIRGHQDAIYSVLFSPDDKHVASASHDMTVRIWDTPGA